MRIISEYTENKTQPTYQELKKMYNTEVLVPTATSTDVFMDTIEMLDDRGISYDVYFNTTNDGCSIFYDEPAPKSLPHNKPPQLTYADVRKLISGMAYKKYDARTAPAKISQLIKKLGYANGTVAPEEQAEFLQNIQTLAHGLTRNRVERFIGEHL